ncbi:MAG: hypothetical protein U5R30_20885 [Deltaproteobacteria bacterium]|nr:hypothetical protein [Deltaproteobacteria bacterium]
MNRLFTSFGTRSWSASRDPALRQPMAIGLVCLFFILLFFVLALAGSRSVARALEAFMHTKGENVIETVVGAAEEKIRYLKAVSTLSPDWTFGLGDLEKSYDIQEAMVAALAELGHDIDSRLATARIAPVDLPKSAAQEHVAGIVVLDSLGAVEAATHPLPEAFQSTVGALRAGSGARDLVVDLAGAGQRSPVAGMIGLRRQSSDGAIILMLDTATLAYWQTKVALQSAIDEVGWRQGVRYFMVVDSSGVLFAGAGEDPSGYGSQSLPQGRASDVPQNADRPVRVGNRGDHRGFGRTSAGGGFFRVRRGSASRWM